MTTVCTVHRWVDYNMQSRAQVQGWCFIIIIIIIISYPALLIVKSEPL